MIYKSKGGVGGKEMYRINRVLPRGMKHMKAEVKMAKVCEGAIYA